ncbi:hypothetical protein [Hymenobacter cellulosilyticus]|uniref:Glycosyltransferase RgtA/B/C/D-like domain-containing protein n=1 Tax=Hymenobacter cellulosilyticus TaxID=2932248 RepID=A0A8T9Q952_9BACT|nr:hypothetical protein [Hymenobacter cellulosilyticus]UOQ73512.1 hypothetical protein MUN79_06135 [Hymenobacter cellulosilyticus]
MLHLSHTSYIWLIIALLMVAAIMKSARWDKNEVFITDRGGYYMYLPSAFIMHDLGDGSWVKAARDQYRPDYESRWEFATLPNGQMGSKFPIGMAVMYSPFFFMAKIAYMLQGKTITTGYEKAYGYMVSLGCMLYVLLGLALLGRELRRYFADHVVALTLLLLALGTNLYSYATYEALMAHGTLFLMNTLLLIATRRWYEQASFGRAAALGAVCGLMVLIRPSEVMMLAVPVLWGLTSFRALGQRLKFWLSRWQQCLTIIALFLLVGGMQFLFWKVVYGQWVVEFYKGETFNFAAPHVWEGVFSFRKGWLIYSPLMIFALLGIGWVREWVKPVLPIVLVLLPIYLYITFCWWDWAYGGSYGGRALISLYPLLSCTMAAFWQRWIGKAPWLWTPIVAALLLLSIAQNYQYSAGLINCCEMTWALYKERFLQLTW